MIDIWRTSFQPYECDMYGSLNPTFGFSLSMKIILDRRPLLQRPHFDQGNVAVKFFFSIFKLNRRNPVSLDSLLGERFRSDKGHSENQHQLAG